MIKPTEIRRIVVLRPNHRLGNTLLLTPLIRELEERFPKSAIELVSTGTAAQTVFTRFPQISEVHTFPTRSFRNPAAVLNVLRKLKQRKYDLAIDPIQHSRAGRFLLGFVRARERLGFRWNVPARDRMLTHSVDPENAPVHFAQSPLHLLHSASHLYSGTSDSLTLPMPLDLRLTEAERREGQRHLLTALGTSNSAGPVLGIFAHATGDKCYPVDWWQKVVRDLRVANPGVQIVEFVPADGRARLGEGFPRLATPNLRLLGAMLAATNRVVVADGGIMHLADAAGARVLGLFKVTEPSRYGPRGPDSSSLRVTHEHTDVVTAEIRASL